MCYELFPWSGTVSAEKAKTLDSVEVTIFQVFYWDFSKFYPTDYCVHRPKWDIGLMLPHYGLQ